jgi:transketolase
MRENLTKALLERSASNEIVFLTGDLGFMALEPLQAALGERFINSGISEQNMVSVAAALAKDGNEVWVYSIAPFLYARAFEQIRNDISFHQLPVNLIGNGGGYGYGVMGPTHHSIEDYGTLLTLKNIEIYVPAFDSDLAVAIEEIGKSTGPTYLRIAKGADLPGLERTDFAGWRQITKGIGPVILVVGPLIGEYIDIIRDNSDVHQANFWVLSKMPISKELIPEKFIEGILTSGKLFVCEEHVAHGGAGMQIVYALAELGLTNYDLVHMFAKEHIYETYGSQAFLRKKSFLDYNSLNSKLL